MENFEQEGVVSLWVFLEKEDPADAQKDILKDLCGVDYYDVAFQEGATGDNLQPLSGLISQLSFASSFIQDALNAAERIGIKEAFAVIAQLDFAYDPTRLTRQISKDPVFIGYFTYHQ